VQRKSKSRTRDFDRADIKAGAARRAASFDFSGKFTAAARAWHPQIAMLGFLQLTWI
jgi:hypothetical protein